VFYLFGVEVVLLTITSLYQQMGLLRSLTVGASGVRSFETATCQGCTEPSRRTTKFLFLTVIRQRRIGGG
jgi:hypothetical protein